jgi:hypothetical protein
MALVVATLSGVYDPTCVWRPVDRGPAKDAPRCYIGVGESGVNYRAGGCARTQRPFVPFLVGLISLIRTETAGSGSL